MMNSKSNKTFLVVGALFLIIGVITLFNGTNFGFAMAQSVLNSNDGSMDIQEYYCIMQSNAFSFQIFGAILSVLGGFSSILAVYKLNDK